jgi:hypothetical protein
MAALLRHRSERLCLSITLIDRLHGISPLRDQLRIASNAGICGGLGVSNVVLVSKFTTAETVTEVF